MHLEFYCFRKKCFQGHQEVEKKGGGKYRERPGGVMMARRKNNLLEKHFQKKTENT